MEKEEMRAAYDLAHNAGCDFVIGVPSIGGSTTVSLTPDQVARLVTDKQAVFAEVMGLSDPEYIEWLQSQGSVYCSGRTRQGRPCRNFIVGGTGLKPDEWKALRAAGGHCTVHGG